MNISMLPNLSLTHEKHYFYLYQLLMYAMASFRYDMNMPLFIMDPSGKDFTEYMKGGTAS